METCIISVKMYILQFVVTISFVLVLSSVQAFLKECDFGAKLQAFAVSLHKTCASKTSISDALIDEVRNGKFIDEPSAKAYMTCILVEGRLIDAKGEPNLELGASLFPENIRDETLKNVKFCYAAHRGVKQLEEKLFKVFKCYYDLNPEDIQFSSKPNDTYGVDSLPNVEEMYYKIITIY